MPVSNPVITPIPSAHIKGSAQVWTYPELRVFYLLPMGSVSGPGALTVIGSSQALHPLFSILGSCVRLCLHPPPPLFIFAEFGGFDDDDAAQPTLSPLFESAMSPNPSSPPPLHDP
jgi:hypothetical protein